MKVFLKTERGTGHQASEDRVLVGRELYCDCTDRTELQEGIIAVADGVGGNKAGGVAAALVCSSLRDSPDLTSERFHEINQMILSTGSSAPEFENMATTLSGLQFFPDRAPLLFHVGNTRVYAIQGGKYLEQLTSDDTLVEFLIQSGKLTEQEAEDYDSRHVITACFGGGSENLLRIKTAECSRYPACLITSDGIHEYLTLDEMEDILEWADGAWDRAAERLVADAKDHGSADDCSAVIITEIGG